MKKVLITVLFVCATVVCNALPFNFGAKIGGNFSTFTVSKSEMKYTFQPGLDIGVFARVNFKRVYVQPELVYSYQTNKFKNDWGEGKGKTHNLSIPILLGYKLIDVKLMNFRAFIGPEFNYVLAQSSSFDYNSSMKPEIDSDRTPANIIGTIGIGLDISMITVDLRYGYAFTEAVKDNVSFNPHNNVISLSLGWKFL